MHVDIMASGTRAACLTLRKHVLEEIAESFSAESTVSCKTIAIFTVTEFKSLVPVRRRIKFLAGLPIGAKLVVGSTLLRVFQNFVGFADLLAALFSIVLLTDVRMILPRQLSIGSLDVILGGVAFNAHYFVVVSEFHREPVNFYY